ncbi:hypothetical protein S40285_02584 [Stachybotrys chlorohalonatus IBT 40285]|uniref:Uncharacterized protein n=1 Tax=Stachybotrys chlorohalonatus (strain IBT 40285) TaxID=1283841 RepID=A0A084QVZ1_STAC4|nr:hypothetical protein S40285_02584 [Stachybotrys chlorohalonata IBT 40285]
MTIEPAVTPHLPTSVSAVIIALPVETMSVISRPLPNAVTYDLSMPGHVKITLPRGSAWSSGLHWHETHDEYLRVVQGSIRVRLGNDWRTVAASPGHQPEVKVARLAWHEWRRAEAGGDEVVVVECTEPADADKALFFWNLNGVILGAPGLLERHVAWVSWAPEWLRGWALNFWVTLSLFVIFAALDNFPVFVDVPTLLPHVLQCVPFHKVDQLLSHLTLNLASWLGWAMGIQPVNPKYTPADAYNAWRSDGSRAAKASKGA